MSSFIVDRNHVRYLVAIARKYEIMWQHSTDPVKWFRLERTDRAAAVRLGNVLWQECIKSVQANYPNQPVEKLPGVCGENYVFTDADLDVEYENFACVQVLKSVKCYEYQSCEHKGWELSEAFRLCRALTEHAIPELPRWDWALWGAPKPAAGVSVMSLIGSE